MPVDNMLITRTMPKKHTEVFVPRQEQNGKVRYHMIQPMTFRCWARDNPKKVVRLTGESWIVIRDIAAIKFGVEPGQIVTEEVKKGKDINA